ncbi:hypothetical protein DL96DRAFT_927990 [Flagelloscypha sp. PMI_526]|nr:hypothetical protein DL96DRAFT_927990 [Flagelloscypha sp. PMI_526]
MGDPGPSTQAYRDRLTVPSHSSARLTSHGHGQSHSPYRLTSTSPSWTPQTPATTRTIYDDAEGYVEVSLDTPDISAAYLEAGQSPQESKPKKFIPGFVRQLSRLPRSFHRNRRVPSEIKLETVPDAIRHTPQEGSIDPYSVYGPSMIPPPPTTSAPGPQPPLAQIPPLSIGTPIEFPQPQVATPPESSHPNIQPPKKLRPHTSSKSSSRVPKSNQPSLPCLPPNRENLRPLLPDRHEAQIIVKWVHLIFQDFPLL